MTHIKSLAIEESFTPGDLKQKQILDLIAHLIALFQRLYRQISGRNCPQSIFDGNAPSEIAPSQGGGYRQHAQVGNYGATAPIRSIIHGPARHKGSANEKIVAAAVSILPMRP
jgi:hypothetical protein